MLMVGNSGSRVLASRDDFQDDDAVVVSDGLAGK
jgi:hypothetical protein